MRMVARLLGAYAALAGVAWLLAALAPGSWPSTVRDVPEWLVAAQVDERVVSLAVVAAWACVAWLSFVLLVVAAGAGRLLPRGAVRATAERVLGIAVVGVAAGALVAGPASADGPFDRPAGPAASPPRAPAATAAPAPTPRVTAAPALPAASASRPVVRPSDPPRAARPPAPPPATPPPSAPAAGEVPAHTAAPSTPGTTSRDQIAARPASGVVVVARGDTLWGIAARRLGVAASPALTAATWPRWYAANRPLIGPDPDLIRPGQRLLPPDGGPR